LSKVCPKCGTGYDDNTSFCERDGRRLEEERPEAIAEYQKELAEACDDKTLEGWELNDLAQLRKKLNISEATHQRLLAEFNVLDRTVVKFYIDQTAGDHLLEGRPGDVPVRIENIDQEKLRKVELLWHVDLPNEEPQELTATRIGPGHSKEFCLPVHPPRAGRYRLSGILTIETNSGTSGTFSFGPTILTVAKEQGHQGNLSVTFNQTADYIDQEGGSFGSVLGGQARGAVGASREWIELPLKGCSEKDIDVWLARARGEYTISRPRRTTPPASKSFNQPIGAISASRVVTIRWSNSSQGSDGWIETVILQPQAVQFGRDPNRALVRLLVEPATAEHRQNIEQSVLISSLHFQLERSPSGLTLTDLGSANRTTWSNGQMIPPHVPQDLQSGASFNIAGVLSLTTTLCRNAAGEVAWVKLNRVNNLQNRSYFMLNDAIGLWPGRHHVLDNVKDPATGTAAGLQLRWINGGLCVCNLSEQIAVNDQVVKPGEAFAIQQGARIQAGGLTGWVSTITP